MSAQWAGQVSEDLIAYSGNYPSLGEYIAPGSVSKPARICIMTQDIFGPIRNAGVGTAFMYAAEYLARAGHSVTILFAQGRISHNRPIEHWIEFYKEKNITFLCAEGISIDAPSPALQWSYMGYHTLSKLPPFDIVHSSECGATPYYSLLAKRNLGAFKDTLFCTKTSSPHLWNRQGNETALNLDSGLIITSAERYCVEKADFVIAPTQHMLDWMVSHGYTLPRHVCVQPNPVPVPKIVPATTANQAIAPVAEATTDDTVVEDPNATPAVQKINELVFFGRLEPRKGILLFAEALELLHRAGTQKCRVVFLGKKNEEFNFDEFLDVLRTKLPFEFRAIHNYDATQAIAYLKEGGRLAVAPSLIDQAALTAYESMVNGVPFVAANIGGIPEIVHPDDRARVLFLPRPQAIYRTLERALKSGAATARLSFEPDHNFAIWDAFHRQPDLAKLNPPPIFPALEPPGTDAVQEVRFGAEALDPLNVEDVLNELGDGSSEYVVIYSEQFELSAEEKARLVDVTRKSRFAIAVPAAITRDKRAGYFVNFEPSLWTKLEFSKIETPCIIVRRTVLIPILKHLNKHVGAYQTNLDTIVSVGCHLGHEITVLPEPFGTFAGQVRKRLTRRQRSRQVEQLVGALPSDLGNLYRMYGALVDERSRVLAVQPSLKNLQRLLRVLRRLDELDPEPVAGSSSLRGRLARWRGWDRNGDDPRIAKMRFKSVGTWLKTMSRLGGRRG